MEKEKKSRSEPRRSWVLLCTKLEAAKRENEGKKKTPRIGGEIYREESLSPVGSVAKVAASSSENWKGGDRE